MLESFDFTGEFYRCTEHGGIIEICSVNGIAVKYNYYNLDVDLITEGTFMSLKDWKYNIESNFYVKDLSAKRDAIAYIAKRVLKEEKDENIRV